MSYNPPELKHELQDTLFCIGIPYKYETQQGKYGIVRTFHLTEIDRYIDIHSMYNIRYENLKFTSMYALKTHLLQKFKHLI